MKFENAVHSLWFVENSNMKPRVCVSCDCFLDSAEHKILLVSNLKKLHNLLKGSSDVLSCLHLYYTAPDCHAGLQQMLLSPCSICVEANGTNQSGYLTCNECYSLQSKSNEYHYLQLLMEKQLVEPHHACHHCIQSN